MSQIYLFIQSFLYIYVDFWMFTLYFGLKCNSAPFLAQTVPTLAFRSSFTGLLGPFGILPSFSFLVFCHYKIAKAHCLRPRISHFSKDSYEPTSSHKVCWLLLIYIAASRPFQFTEQGNACMYTDPLMHISINISKCTHLFLY